jgi:hypothetical protein
MLNQTSAAVAAERTRLTALDEDTLLRRPQDAELVLWTGQFPNGLPLHAVTENLVRSVE